MKAYRIAIAGGICAIAALSASCGAVSPADRGERSDDLILPAAYDFNGAKEVPVAARRETATAGSASIAGNLLGETDTEADLLIDGGGLTIREDHTPGHRSSSDGRHESHVTLGFRLGRSQREACASDIYVGPIEAKVVGPSVALEQTSMRLPPSGTALVRGGRFGICAETSGDFDGSVGLNGLSFAFHGKGPGNGSGTARVEICHIPPDDPASQHTIVVAQPAVEAHLAHGDYLGPCVDAGGTADDPDSDGDGVTDANDQCPGTPAGDQVYPSGCTVIVLLAQAGPDISLVEGEVASATASAQVVQGDYNPENLIFVWTQTGGDQVPYETSGPSLTVSTTDTPGEFVFLVTVSTHDGLASSTDQLTITVMPARVMRVTAGKWHNIALFQDRDIVPWGTNQNGQLGDGTLLESIEDVDAGSNATLLAVDDGLAWTMGSNALSNSAVPLEIAGVADVLHVAAQYDGGILLDGNGIAWGFGDARNLQCELAGAPHPEATGVVGPIPVPGLTSNIVAISAANYHAIAVDANGLAWVWGARFGCTPRAILNNVTAVAAGDSGFCLMLRSDGTAWGIGYNNFGQLGNGTTASSFSMVTQVTGLSNVVQVAAGHAHSLFVTADGNLWATGWNRYCQLGLEDEVSPAQPTFGVTITRPLQVGLTNVRSVSGGYIHTVAVRDDGTVWAWGSNGAGQLSSGTASVLPQSVCMPTMLDLPEPQ